MRRVSLRGSGIASSCFPDTSLRMRSRAEEVNTVNREQRERLVIIGNGMAGARVVEEILQRDAQRFTITMFGAEPYGNYNRILLSNVLNGSQRMEDIFLNPLSWYSERRITLHAGVKAMLIDRTRRVVIGKPLRPAALPYELDGCDPSVASIEEPYDKVIIATGSRPFITPINGVDNPGVF